MFDRILAMFHQEASITKLPEADAQHAMGALLVRAAKIDKAYLFEEIEQIDDVLAHLYALNPVQAAKMRAECEKLEEAMPDTDALSTILHDAIGIAEREATVAALWAVVFADGVEAEAEDALLHQVADILGVSPEVSKRLHDEAMTAHMPG